LDSRLCSGKDHSSASAEIEHAFARLEVGHIDGKAGAGANELVRYSTLPVKYRKALRTSARLLK
jgi:hypothetical protein